MDGIGYSPDIWCNPKNALDVAFRFIETSGLAQKDAVDAMRTHFPEVKTDLITLRFNDGTVEKTSSEIISNMGTVAEVYFDGEHITDFEITSSSTYATIDNDGEKIRLIPAQSGKIYKFRVHYDGRYAEFFWRTP